MKKYLNGNRFEKYRSYMPILIPNAVLRLTTFNWLTDLIWV